MDSKQTELWEATIAVLVLLAAHGDGTTNGAMHNLEKALAAAQAPLDFGQGGAV